MQGHYNVLFLCTGNSARSIMAEAILNRKGRPNFTAYSAGSHPTGHVHPAALAAARDLRVSLRLALRSKNWDEFAKPGAPELDFVFTVCDNAAKEVCPIWPGQPMTAHWGVPDPAAVEGTPEQIEKAFREAFMILDRRISLFLCLPLSSLDKLAIKKEIDRIGHAMKIRSPAGLSAEFIGTAFLVAAVVGSGIMGERLAGGNVALALLANTIATGAALVALIFTFGRISGAHFNPALSHRGRVGRRTALERNSRLRLRSDRRRDHGRCRGPRHVRAAARFALASRSQRTRTSLQRIHRDVRSCFR